VKWSVRVATESSKERRQLAVLIRDARHHAPTGTGRRMTQGELGLRIGYSQANIQKIEAADIGIDPQRVEAVIAATGVDRSTAERMRELARYAAVGIPYADTRAPVPGYAHRYIEAEGEAREILTWHELRLPGPLQSEHVMLSQFSSANAIDVAPFVRERMRRKAIFGQPQLRRYGCVLAEEALHRVHATFGREVMLDQIDQLLRLNDPADAKAEADDRTAIQILPATTPIAHLPVDFSIVTFADEGRGFVYVEHVAGGHYPKSKESLAKARNAWDELHDAALDRQPTNDFLRKLRDGHASG
jgi:hypothetical protein